MITLFRSQNLQNCENGTLDNFPNCTNYAQKICHFFSSRTIIFFRLLCDILSLICLNVRLTNLESSNDLITFALLSFNAESSFNVLPLQLGIGNFSLITRSMPTTIKFIFFKVIITVPL